MAILFVINQANGIIKFIAMSISIVPQLTEITEYVEPYVLPRYTGQDLINFNDFNKDLQYDILLKLMGAYMYVDFANDFQSGIPQSQKYLNLLNGVNLYNNLSSCCNEQYLGLRPMLISLIWAEYTLHRQNKETRAGTKVQHTNNSKQINQTEIQKRYYIAWNKGVKFYNDAYNYMFTNCDQYPEFITCHQPLKIKGFLNRDNIL